MGLAFVKTTAQFERANSPLCRLEKEKCELEKGRDATTYQPMVSAVNCQEALHKEKDTLKRSEVRPVQRELASENIFCDKLNVI